MSETRKYLEKVSREFSRDTFFVPVTGAEVEFYLTRNASSPALASSKNPERFFGNEASNGDLLQVSGDPCSQNFLSESQILTNFASGMTSNLTVKKEDGKNQYEVELIHTNDVVKLADEIVKIREEISKFAAENNLTADFSPSPFRMITAAHCISI